MSEKKQHIIICGIGPGNPDYIVPAVFNKVNQADILIGGKRQLEIFNGLTKQTCLFDGKLNNLKEIISNCTEMNIVVLVSGDTGFYSLRRFLTHEFPLTAIEIIPGISSYQYFYARLGMGYENAFLGSLHGAEAGYIEKLEHFDSVFLLTDLKNNWKSIAQNLVEKGYGQLKMHLGNNLSYPDEKIISETASEISFQDFEFKLCSVIIENTTKNEG